MARCTRTWSLGVHHKRRDGGDGLDNATVLCQKCHEGTETYGKPGKEPPPFSEKTKLDALEQAKNQCQCTSTRGCH